MSGMVWSLPCTRGSVCLALRDQSNQELHVSVVFWGECCAGAGRVSLVVRMRLCASARKAPMALGLNALLQWGVGWW
jgi:hypothetical protein